MKSWEATKAKQKFSDLIESSKNEPQLVERRGKPVSVVVSFETFIESKGLNRRQSIAAWLSELHGINESEDEMEEISRFDRMQPDWE